MSTRQGLTRVPRRRGTDEGKRREEEKTPRGRVDIRLSKTKAALDSCTDKKINFASLRSDFSWYRNDERLENTPRTRSRPCHNRRRRRQLQPFACDAGNHHRGRSERDATPLLPTHSCKRRVLSRLDVARQTSWSGLHCGRRSETPAPTTSYLHSDTRSVREWLDQNKAGMRKNFKDSKGLP